MQSFQLQTIINSVSLDTALWILFGFALIVFGVFSAILLWHWKLYSTGKFTTVSNMILYLGVGASLFFIMIVSIVWYSIL